MERVNHETNSFNIMTRSEAVSVINSFSFRESERDVANYKLFSNGRGEEIYLGVETVEYNLRREIFTYTGEVQKADLIKFIRNEQN